MNLVWEDIAPLICDCGKDHCDAANHADDMSPERYAEKYGCESKEVCAAAERVVKYVNDRAKPQIKNTVGIIKLKYWWSEDRKWFCMIVNDGANEATISLTPEEASLLSMNAVLEPA